MKVKFISKKDRELIKAEKQVNPPNPQRAQNESTHHSDQLQQSARQNNQPSIRSTQANAQANRPARVDQPAISEHLIREQREGSFEGIRERSREHKYKEVTRDELQERARMKSKLLGLEKIEESKRFNPQYRRQLLFEWDKSEDTSQGFAPMFAQPPRAQPREALGEQGGWQAKPLQKMQERDWRIFREDHEIYIRGGKAAYPVRQWGEVEGGNAGVVGNLERMGFQRPKPIQMQSIPIGMAHKDLMAIAPTGEGKTLGYLFPIIHFLLPLERLSMANFDQGPYALVLVPSRELAEQIQQEFIKFTRDTSLTSFVAVGGRQFEMQAIELSKGCDILIGTPGRVKEFIEKHQLSLERLSWCVVDQADKMVSQNLSDDLEFILESGGQDSLFAGRKVVSMFSATMVPEVEKLGKQYLAPDYTYLTIGEPGGGKKEIDQHVELIDQNYKPERLSKILRGLAGPIIVFANTREKCEKVATLVRRRCERSVAEYHGGKNQEERERVISALKARKVEILVATDLAGRGLDVKGINAVINYDAPKNISEFVHRSGRTGRAGMRGKAYTLLTADDEALFYDLRVFLERNEFRVPENLKQNPAAIVRPGAIGNVKRSKQIVYTN